MYVTVLLQAYSVAVKQVNAYTRNEQQKIDQVFSEVVNGIDNEVKLLEAIRVSKSQPDLFRGEA